MIKREFEDDTVVVIERHGDGYRVSILEGPDEKHGYGSYAVLGLQTFEQAHSFVTWGDFDPDENSWSGADELGLSLDWQRIDLAAGLSERSSHAGAYRRHRRDRQTTAE